MAVGNLLDQAFVECSGWARLRDRIAWMTRRTDAEDLLHDAWLGLKLRNVDARNPHALLIRVASNSAIDAYRKEQRLAEHFQRDLDTGLIADAAPLQDEVLIAQEQMERLRAGMAQLSPRTREIFLMHRLEGLKYREIAQKLEISQSAVEKHIAKAMLHLIEWMESW